MKSTDFLKKLSKEDKVAYSNGALANLLNALTLAYDETEFFEMVSEFTSDLNKYLNNLSLLLRDLGIKCQNIQCMTKYDLKNIDYFDDISYLLHIHYKNEMKSYYNRDEAVKKIDLAKL